MTLLLELARPGPRPILASNPPRPYMSLNFPGRHRLSPEDAIRHVPGIRRITDRIAVRPHAAPTEVKSQIERALQRHADLDASRIEVNADGGMVVLRGAVRSLGQKEEAERVARSAAGIF